MVLHQTLSLRPLIIILLPFRNELRDSGTPFISCFSAVSVKCMGIFYFNRRLWLFMVWVGLKITCLNFINKKKTKHNNLTNIDFKTKRQLWMPNSETYSFLYYYFFEFLNFSHLGPNKQIFNSIANVDSGPCSILQNQLILYLQIPTHKIETIFANNLGSKSRGLRAVDCGKSRC
jgi:hypothetical protein